jgi:AraC-like DNA-binding protein/tetratricopeptide (TPR) repeat protein
MSRIIVLLLCLLFVCSSCKQKGSGVTDQDKNGSESRRLRLKAQTALKARPDSALLYAEAAIRLIERANPTDTSLYALMFIKANAWIAKEIPDSAIKLLEDFRLKAARSSDTLAQARLVLKLGKIALNTGRLTLASKYLLDAILLFENIPAKEELGVAYRLYGELLSRQAKSPQSQLYLIKAYAIFENTNNYLEISRVSLSFGNNFYDMGDRENELTYSRMAVHAAQQAQDTNQQILSLTNLGVYYRTENPDSAFYYYNRSLSLNPAGVNNRQSIIAKFNIANLNLDKKEYARAKEEFLLLLDVCRVAGYYDGIVRIYCGLASLYAKTGNYREPVAYLNLAKHIADSIGNISLSFSMMKELADAQTMAGNFKEALRLANEAQTLKDSLLVQDSQEHLQEMGMVYQSEKRDQENKSLTTLVSVQSSNLRNRMILIVLLALASIILAFALVIGYRWNNQRNLAYGVLINKIKEEDEYRETLPVEPASSELELEIGLTVKPPSELMDEIEKYFCEDKPYLDPKLKIEDVSSSLSISTRVIALLLKDYKNINFVSFVNQYRIDRSKKMMNDHAYRNYKIEAIAIESGFGTRQSFYNAFEQQIGMKPSYYREYISKNNLLLNEDAIG